MHLELCLSSGPLIELHPTAPLLMVRAEQHLMEIYTVTAGV